MVPVPKPASLYTLNTLKISNTIIDTPNTKSIYILSSKVCICAPNKYYREQSKLKL
jgi:hypothetical protein